MTFKNAPAGNAVTTFGTFEYCPPDKDGLSPDLNNFSVEDLEKMSQNLRRKRPMWKLFQIKQIPDHKIAQLTNY